MTWEQEQKIKRARYRKASRFVSRFFHQMRVAGVEKPETDKAALEKAIAKVRDASSEEWAQLAKDMGERGPPSGETIALIVGEMQSHIDNLDRARKQAAEDAELIRELYRQRHEGVRAFDEFEKKEG